MAKVQAKKKVMTKKDRSKSKGTMSRKKVTVRSSGKGIATAAIAKRK
jgi:uridine phosphorylase